MKSVLIGVIAALTFGSAVQAQVHVRGHTRSDGTYVAPHTRSSPNSTTSDNYGSYRATAPRTTNTAPRSLYATPAPAAPACSGYSCYGQPSTTNGQPRTNEVSGYTRSDGTYVAPYYRSSPQ